MTQARKFIKNAVNLLVVLGLLLASPAQAQLGKRPAKDYIAVLENPSRIERLKTSEVISRLKLKNGDVVADIGAGSGVFTGKLAEAVGPQGKVFAVDIDQELLDYNREKNREFTNVEFVLGGFDEPKLPAGSSDLIFICDVVHHIAHRELYLRHLRGCIRPTGRLAIIDYKTNWPPGHEEMKYSIEELLNWTTNAGFEKIGEFDLISDAFFYLFKPIQPPVLPPTDHQKKKP